MLKSIVTFPDLADSEFVSYAMLLGSAPSLTLELAVVPLDRGDEQVQPLVHRAVETSRLLEGLRQLLLHRLLRRHGRPIRRVTG